MPPGHTGMPLLEDNTEEGRCPEIHAPGRESSMSKGAWGMLGGIIRKPAGNSERRGEVIENGGGRGGEHSLS